MRCRFRWCTAPHATVESAGRHVGNVAEFTGLSVRLALVEQPGDEPDDAYVRLLHSAGATVRTYDVTPQAAIDWSELLAGIDVRDLAAVCQALYRAGLVLESVTQP